MNKPAIAVHAMFPLAYHQTHPSQAAAHIHNADTLLAQGRTIARAGCGLSGWRAHDTISTRGCFLRNAFTYVFPPPLAPTTADVPSSAVKEWNTRPSESEIFSIAGLRPFESTLVSLPPGNPAVLVHDQKLDDPPQSPKKRVKVNVDVGPLDELIPLPHYISAPLDVRIPLPRSPLDIHPTFAPIPPQTTSSVEDLLSSIYARVAWLIPVRGVQPWNDVSRASVALGHLSVLGPGHLPASDIVWTHDALRQFWTFLCSCSETQGSVTGPLSLSFHTAPRSSSMRSQQGTTLPGASPCHLANNESEMTSSDPEPLMPIVRVLTDIDYVKVYCDAPWAMSVRRMLAQWTYEEDGCAEGARTVGGIQFLEFAKLVLVNETGEGVLVS
ncbi:hypothetical protein EDB92DRAFT_1863102 [Lactarius akahatsu]|uniref:Uncharacterized protein n=1 Tax=Lactarius akahatsu TaxID=416441 RepID=A0AAD4LJE3_9AGAM|nr:hypothetical protein EDB92DRAFT_1863102 [Lactarius akahatsu]